MINVIKCNVIIHKPQCISIKILANNNHYYTNLILIINFNNISTF